MAFKNLANMSSRNFYDFLYEQKAVVWLRVVHNLLSEEEMCSFPSILCTKCITLTQRKCLRRKRVELPQDCFGAQHVLRFIVSEVKMLCCSFPKAKATQSRVS